MSNFRFAKKLPIVDMRTSLTSIPMIMCKQIKLFHVPKS